MEECLVVLLEKKNTREMYFLQDSSEVAHLVDLLAKETAVSGSAEQ